MAKFMNMLESALETLDEKAEQIGEKVNEGTEESKPKETLPLPPLPAEVYGEEHEELVRKRGEIEKRKGEGEEQTREEIDLLTAEKDALKKTNETKAERIAQLETLIEETKTRTHQQISTLLDQKDTAEKEWHAASLTRDTTLKELHAQYDGAVDAMRQKDEFIASIQAKSEDWLLEKEKLTNEHHQLTEGLKNELHETTIKMESESKLSAQLQERVESAELEVTELQRELDSKEEDARAASALIQTKELQIRSGVQELEQYKARVSKVVTDREEEVKLLREKIASLMEGGIPPPSSEKSPYEQENKNLKIQIEKLETALEDAKREATNYVLLKDHEQAALKRKADEAALQLDIKIQEMTGLEALLSRNQEEHLQQTQEGLKAKSNASTLLREKEISIQQLEKKLNQKEDAGATSDLAVKCQKLGQSLLEKQSMLETRTMEVEQSQMKLRGALQKIKELESLSQPATTTYRARDIEAQEIPDLAPYHVRNSLFLQNISRRSAFGKNLTSVATNIDNFTIKTARVLRRHALLRLGVVIYITLLHLWMFLFTGMVLPQGTPTVLNTDVSGSH